MIVQSLLLAAASLPVVIVATSKEVPIEAVSPKHLPPMPPPPPRLFATEADLATLPPLVTLGGRAKKAKALNAGEWIGQGDYPQSSLRWEETGITNFVLHVSKKGRVKRCHVVSSSATATLDEATCRLISARARFEPARNAKGKSVEDRYQSRIIWRLPY